MFDAFFSYAHVDLTPIRPLIAALQERGLRIWWDEHEIDAFSGITDAVAAGIASSKVLVAYYSAAYPQRRPCQWELTRAFLTAQLRDDPRRRILVINPELANAHIHPVELRDARFQPAPQKDDAGSIATVIDAIAKRVAEIDTPFGDPDPRAVGRWYPAASALGSLMFVGRLSEMWLVHSALHGKDVALITGTSGPPIAQVRGMAGVGKSLVAQEYARRFGAAYPGGVMWFHISGSDKDAAAQNYFTQLGRLAGSLSIGLEQNDLGAALQSIGSEIEKRGEPCLWVLDDVPEYFAIDDLRDFVPPCRIARILLTSRTRAFDAILHSVDLDVLPPEDGLRLLTARREPQDREEWNAARKITEALGGLALALDITGSALYKLTGLQSFSDFLSALDRPDRDELEAVTDLADALPLSHERSIVRTLLRSMGLLNEAGRIFIDLAVLMADAPIPAEIVADTFAHWRALDHQAAIDLAARAINDVLALSLVRPAESAVGCWRVHVLVARVRLHHQHKADLTGLQEALTTALRDALRRATQRAPVGIDVFAVTHAAHLARHSKADRALLGDLGNYYMYRGQYADARRILERHWAANSDLLGTDAPETLAAETALADALYRGNYHPDDLENAERHHRHAYNGRLRILGGRHPDTLTSMERLAEITTNDGRIGEAKVFLDQVIPGRELVLGHEHPDTLHAVRLAAIRRIKTGDRMGVLMLRELLRAQEEVLGSEHLETLATLDIAARLVESAGDATLATPWFERVLAGRRRALGEDHPETIAAANALSNHLMFKRGDWLRGSDVFRAAELADRRRQIGSDRPTAQDIERRNTEVQALIARGELWEAKERLDRLVETSRDVLGDDDAVTLRVMTTFADILLAMGHPDGALHGHQLVLERRRKVLGEDDSETEYSRRKVIELRGKL